MRRQTMVMLQDFQIVSEEQVSMTIFPIQSADRDDMEVLNLENKAYNTLELLVS